jgi:hypothetical protein
MTCLRVLLSYNSNKKKINNQVIENYLALLLNLV